jgi:hypothetical protein
MRLDRIEQRFVRERGIAEAEIVIGRSLLAQSLANREARARQKLRQQQARRRAFQVFDNMWLDPRIAGHRKCVA